MAVTDGGVHPDQIAHLVARVVFGWTVAQQAVLHAVLVKVRLCLWPLGL